jgi:hypothetical protein
MKEKNLKFAEEFNKMFPVGEGTSGGGLSPIAYSLTDNSAHSQITQHMAYIVAKVFASPIPSESLEETKARADVAVGTFIRMIGQFSSHCS